MNTTERDLRRRLKKSIRKRTELNNRIIRAIKYIQPRFIVQGAYTSYEINDLLNEVVNILKGNK